jgi:Ca2+-binding RTX toxin-like protein
MRILAATAAVVAVLQESDMAVLFAEMRWTDATFDMSKLFKDIGNRTHIGSQTADPLGGVAVTVNGVAQSFAPDTVTFARLYLLGASRDTGFGGDGIVINAADEITAGQGNTLGFTNNAGLNYNISGFSAGLTELYASSLTADLTDDMALRTQVFSGDDYIVLLYAPFQTIPNFAGGGNRFNSGAGKDFVLGAAGNDTLRAGKGDDIVQAGFGNDGITGRAGRDLLFGEAGMDRIEGGHGRDTLIGGSERDILIGDGGGDSFVFAPGGGQDFVVDFEVGVDRIVISGIETDFDGLSLFQGINGVQVSFSDSSFVLLNVFSSDLSATDFIFGGNRMMTKATADFFTDWNYCA